MALNSVSHLTLDINANVNPGSLSKLKALRKELESLMQTSSMGLKEKLQTVASATEKLRSGSISSSEWAKAENTVKALGMHQGRLVATQKELAVAQNTLKSGLDKTNSSMAANRQYSEQVNSSLKEQRNLLKDLQNVRSQIKANPKNTLYGGNAADLIRQADEQIAITKSQVAQLEQAKRVGQQERNMLSARRTEQLAASKEVNSALNETNKNLNQLAKTSDNYEKAFSSAQRKIAAAEKTARNESMKNWASQFNAREVIRQKAAAESLKNIAIEGNRQNAEKIKSETQWQKQVTSLEGKRITMMRQASEMSAKTYRIPELSQQYKDIFNGLEKVTSSTTRGQKAIQAFGKDLERANLQYQKHITSLNMFSRSYEKFKMILERVRDALLSFMVMNAIYKVVTGFFTSLIDSNQILDTLNARLKALVPTSQEVASIWEELKRLTITTPFKIDEFIEASVLVKAFGVDIKENMESIADWASAVGKDLSDTAVAYGKIASYSPRTSLLLSTRGFSMTMFESYVTKYGERATALKKMIEDTFGGTAQQVSLTFKGIMSNISDLWTFTSQTLGKPLFEGLKADLQFLYRAMSNLEQNGKGALSAIGEGINFLVKLGAIGTISTVFALLIHQVWILVSAIKAAKVETILWMKQFAISSAVTLIGVLIYSYTMLADSMMRVKELQNEYNQLSSEASSMDRIRNLEEQNSLLEQQASFWSVLLLYLREYAIIVMSFGLHGGNFHGKQYIEDLEAQIKANKDLIEVEKKRRAEKQRELLLMSAQVDIFGDKDLMAKVKEYGFTEEFKKMAEDAKLNLPIIDKALQEVAIQKGKLANTGLLGGGRIGAMVGTRFYTEEELLNQRTFIEAQSIYLKGLTQEVTEEEIRADQLEKIRRAVLMITPQMTGGQQAFANFKKMIDEFFENQPKKVKDAIDKLKDYKDEFLDLLRQIAGERAQFEGFANDEDTAKISKMAEIYGRLQYDFGKKNVGMEDFKRQLAERIDLEERYDNASVANKNKIRADLKKELATDKDINQYLQYRLDLETKIKDSVKSQNDKVTDLKNSYRDLARAAIDSQYSFGDISTEEYLGKLLSQKNRILLAGRDIEKDKLKIKAEIATTDNPVRQLELENQLADKERDKVQNLQDYLNLLHEIFALPSSSWGDAFFKQFVRLRAETEKWRDDLAEIFATTLSTAISDSIRELVSGAETAAIDEQISGLQTQLIEARNTKAQILGLQMQTTIVEDEEAKILAQINELEAQRASVILNKFMSVFDAVFKKVEEIAANKIVMWLMGELGMGGPLQAQMLELEKIYSIANAGAAGLVALSAQDYLLALDRLAVEQQIAATKNGLNVANIASQIVRSFGSTGMVEGDIPIVGDPWGGVQRNRPNAPIERTLTPAVSPSGKIVQIVFNGPVYGQKDFNKAVDEATRKIRSKVV